MSDKLFQPLKVGSLELAHRVVMAPLTRFRANDNNVPLPFVKTYYEQRAAVPGTLLITEATYIAAHAGGYRNVPGIFSEEQIQAWKEVTDAVHSKKSYIFCQLWALGRVAMPDVLKKGGFKLVSSSPIPMDSEHDVPDELTEADIRSYIADFAQAAKNAIKAGFDGVEVHGANGYLPDQFLQDTVNARTDRWGGSVDNRSRFHLEITKAVIDAIGAECVGVRLSPYSSFQGICTVLQHFRRYYLHCQGMRMDEPIPQFTHVIKGLKQLNIAYLHLVESRVSGSSADGVYDATGKLDFALEAWGSEKPVILAGGFTSEKAQGVANGHYKQYNVAVAFGRYFISTPDLPFRVRHDLELNTYDRRTFYKPVVEDGYTDYPFSKEFLSAKM